MECKRLGVPLPPDHEHAYDEEKLKLEEEEYDLAYRLLCPSDFVVKTFLDKGLPEREAGSAYTGLMRRGSFFIPCTQSDPTPQTGFDNDFCRGLRGSARACILLWKHG